MSTAPPPLPVESTQTWQRRVGDIQGEPGPTLLCIGGIHGNEPAGLIAAQTVIQKIEHACNQGDCRLRGRIYALAGNLAALNASDPALRYFTRDLNRMFDPSAIDQARHAPEQDRFPEQTELLELLALIEPAMRDAPPGSALMDLHTVSSESPAFAYVEDSLPARKIGLALDLPLVVGLGEELTGLLADYATTHLGVLSLLAEAGTHEDPESVTIHEAAIWITMQTLGMIDDADADAFAGFDVRAKLHAAADQQAGRFFDIRQRVTIGDPPLEMLDRARAFTRVWKGITPIARRTHQGATETIRAPADGILFMPNRQARKNPTDDAFFILRPVWTRFLRLSGLLRQQAWPHRLLRLLPGVKADPADPHTLRVDHDVAALMARDLLHLLGYRVHRAPPTRYRRPLTRLLLAVWVIPRILLRLARLLPTKNDEIWLVRRHRLDVEPAHCDPPSQHNPIPG